MSEGEPRTSSSLLGRLGRTPRDEASWSEFVKNYTPMLQAWCRQSKLQTADAEDLIQYVWQRLAQAMPDFNYDPDKKFRGFLRKVTDNALIDLQKKWSKPGRGAGGSDALQMLMSQPAQDSLVECLHHGLEHEMLWEEAKRRVQLRVKPKTWELFQLYLIEDLSGAEVASRLGLKVTTVSGAALRVLRMVEEEVALLQGKGMGHDNLSP